MSDDNISSAELARRMGDVLRQFENLVKQVEDRYVRRDVVELWEKGIELQVQQVKENLGTKANKSDLPDMSKYVGIDAFNALLQDVKEIKDNGTWLWRIVIGAIVLGVLGAVITFGAPK